ncbi:hypothetical protein XELAEV_18036409mg [Xenopus laevis]|uniref:Uncharacterized protein n=1 Tax=Xenopus laevis TaxID=8355 RepID=A0A974CHK8_XENLA|nr:hypothetical protein XELAEV_18036409mg [Xenopus laevis]
MTQERKNVKTPGPSVVPHSVCAPHLPLCLGRVHLWFFILYVPLTFPFLWAGSICGSSLCMCPSPSPLSGQAKRLMPAAAWPGTIERPRK